MHRVNSLGALEYSSFSELALELLNVLPPARYAVNASKHGIVIYDRDDYGKTTAWELLIWKDNRPLPADWIGFLSASFQPRHRCNESSSPTSYASAKRSPRERIFRRVEGVDSSETRLSVTLQESNYDGQSQEEEGTTLDS